MISAENRSMARSLRSALAYSAQNEDYRTELALIDRLAQPHGLRVLMVCSSGENALSLLTRVGIASVTAVDTNPAQVQLCELRRAAAAVLSRDEQLALLGADPSNLGPAGADARALAA